MKSFILLVIKAVLVVTVLTGYEYGVVSGGGVNLIIFWAWVEAILIIIGAWGTLAVQEVLKDVAEKAKGQLTSKVRGKLSTALMSGIGYTFIWWDYWFTGIVWIVSVVLLLIVKTKINEINKAEAES